MSEGQGGADTAEAVVLGRPGGVGGVDLGAGAGDEVPRHEDRFGERSAAEQGRAGRFAHLQAQLVAAFAEVSE
ncbi:hypothetical protein NW895_33700 [Streptomyces sp. S.PNR 29]|nr:hypothetical protein [Streptomyces sp. S.PNR 29]MDN0199913.1 hypothetical protein [Streptomyces sp. S.PNR 29]